MALGMAFVIIAGGIDLSIGSMTAFIGALTVISINALLPKVEYEPIVIVLGILVALVTSILCGGVNGILITQGKIAPFIVTLGTMAIFRSLTLYSGDAGEFQCTSNLFGDFTMGGFFLPIPVWVFLSTAALLSILLNKTRFGRYVCAVGSNANVAMYSAVNVNRVRFLTYVISGLTVGISSVLLSSRFNAVSSSNTGLGFELDAIAAVIVGGTAMTGGRGTIWGTVAGAITLGVINNMMNMVGVSPYLQGTVKGLVIISAVYIQRQKQ
jgi:ribose transport system permease protein